MSDCYWVISKYAAKLRKNAGINNVCMCIFNEVINASLEKNWFQSTAFALYMTYFHTKT